MLAGVCNNVNNYYLLSVIWTSTEAGSVNDGWRKHLVSVIVI